MPTLLENVAQTAQLRADIEADFKAALVQARAVHSWAEIAQAAGMKPSGVRWYVSDKRSNHTKGEK